MVHDLTPFLYLQTIFKYPAATVKYMKPYLILFMLIFFLSSAFAQHIYSKAYGIPENTPVIFIHGGPSGNATLFEGTTAPVLAAKGFYVIVYDRRGEGRSKDSSAKFTFQEAFDDLNQLIADYRLKKVTLIGHSFGGIVSTLFTDAYSDKVERLILADALVSQQQTYDHVLSSVGKLAKQKLDTAMLKKIALTRMLDKNSADYRKYCFEIASAYGYFKMPFPTEDSKRLSQTYESGIYAKTNIRNIGAPAEFYRNERLVRVDTKPVLKRIISKGIGLFAFYGAQDRIFSPKQIRDLKDIVGAAHFTWADNCSHYPFVDQQSLFIDSIMLWMGK